MVSAAEVDTECQRLLSDRNGMIWAYFDTMVERRQRP